MTGRLGHSTSCDDRRSKYWLVFARRVGDNEIDLKLDLGYPTVYHLTAGSVVGWIECSPSVIYPEAFSMIDLL